MDDVPRLPDEHLEKAKQIIASHIKKRSCKQCYGRGFRGIDQNNMAILCHKCVDEDAVMEDWKAYVRDTPELSEAYGDYFEEEEEEAEKDEKHPSQHGHAPGGRPHSVKDGPHTSAGTQHHRPGNR